MSEDERAKEAASKWGRERRARRREFDPAVVVTQLDKRYTRNPKAKHVRKQITLTPNGLAQIDARRAYMNEGRGMSLSEFLEYCALRYCKKGQREWLQTKEAGRDE